MLVGLLRSRGLPRPCGKVRCAQDKWVSQPPRWSEVQAGSTTLPRLTTTLGVGSLRTLSMSSFGFPDVKPAVELVCTLLLTLATKTIGNTFLAVVTQWIEHQTAHQRVAGSIPSQGTCPGWGPGPQFGGRGCARGNQAMYLLHVDISLLFFLPSHLSKNK